jgi:hypothetical protein
MDPTGKLLVRRPSASARVERPRVPQTTAFERICMALELGREGKHLQKRATGVRATSIRAAR